MCVNCGYDLKANVVREAELGEAVAPPEPPASLGAKEFVTVGRGSAQVLATCGVFITLAALIIAGVNARQWGAWVVLGSVALVLYNIALHTCTGVLAVVVASKLSEERFTRLELSAARMFVAVSLFYAVRHSALPIPVHFLATFLIWSGAILVYVGAVWFFFRKDRYAVALIAIAHFMMWLMLQLGGQLAAWVASGQATQTPNP